VTDEPVCPDREDAAERYLLGLMGEAERERYEEHFFDCPACAEAVRTTAAFLDDVRVCLPPPERPLRTAAIVDAMAAARTVPSLLWPLPASAAFA
jgi:anti-sigma factor RsiW